MISKLYVTLFLILRTIFFLVLRALCLFVVATSFAQAPLPPVAKLSQLKGDVLITSPTDKQVLTWNATDSKWENMVSATGALAGLSDVSLGSLVAGNLLRYNGTAWINQSPAFTDLSGNIAVTQMNNGSGATSSTYWRGDGTWSAPATGGIPATSNLLTGDGAGNALDAFSGSQGVQANAGTPTFAVRGDASVNTQTTISLTNGLGGSTALSHVVMSNDVGSTLNTEILSSTNNGGNGVFTAGDSRIMIPSGSTGNLDLVVQPSYYIKFSGDGGSGEKARIGNGMSIGGIADPGTGIISIKNGIRMNGTAPANTSLVGDGTNYNVGNVPGKVSVTTTVDQTVTTETISVGPFTVSANTANVGTTYRIYAWGDMDNGTTAITYTPHIRWGGTAGVSLMAVPTPVSTTTAGTNRNWMAEGYVIIRTTGATGTATASLFIANHIATALPGYAADMSTSGGTPITIDTTANKDLVFTWTLSSTTGTPHVRTYGGSIEIVKP